MAANDGYFDIGQYTGAQTPPALPERAAPVSFIPPEPTQPETPAGSQGGGGGMGMGSGLIPTMVGQTEQQLGRRLTADELNSIRERVKAQHLPGLMPKGVQQWQF